ncbi:MAG: TIGR00730 family Rossman fold protein [Alphaproteobacteria bacterium]|nr:TIGR00730 family Rossman fold protein [Alphaproteobacteria bacterium]
MIKNLCVFCGSSLGSNPAYAEGAAQLAKILLNNNITLVYGGANVGLMRVLADTVLKGGGKVVGVMPRSLVEKEVAHQHLTEMHIVDGMQERKALMADLSDAFIALPGAFGTLDEIFEVLTWNQLGIIHKPLGLFNTGGYFDPLLAMLNRAVEQQFLRPEHRKMVLEFNSVEEIIGQLEAYRPVEAPKWIERLKEGKI